MVDRSHSTWWVEAGQGRGHERRLDEELFVTGVRLCEEPNTPVLTEKPPTREVSPSDIRVSTLVFSVPLSLCISISLSLSLCPSVSLVSALPL